MRLLKALDIAAVAISLAVLAWIFIAMGLIDNLSIYLLPLATIIGCCCLYSTSLLLLIGRWEKLNAALLALLFVLATINSFSFISTDALPNTLIRNIKFYMIKFWLVPASGIALLLSLWRKNTWELFLRKMVWLYFALGSITAMGLIYLYLKRFQFIPFSEQGASTLRSIDLIDLSIAILLILSAFLFVPGYILYRSIKTHKE